MKINRFFFLGLLVLFNRTAFGQKRIFNTEAENHIGEHLIVAGKVNCFKILNSKTILLFCGRKYPRKYFTVIVKDRTITPIEHPKLAGWNIYVVGVIIKYKGKPAIRVRAWSDVHPALFADGVPNDL